METTKGIWTVACDSYGHVQHSRKACVFAYDESGKKVGPTVAHAIANWNDAHLISAAPQMYQSLKELVWIAEATHGAHDRVSRAKAALAKAEGEVQPCNKQ